MNIVKSIILMSIGAIFGIGMVLSCGDNSSHHSDAGTCDCPASEPPISGRITTIDSNLVTINPGAQGLAGITCNPGMQFISGSCTGANLTILDDIVLQQAGFDKATGSWACAFKNNKVVAVQVKATALCLKPST